MIFKLNLSTELTYKSESCSFSSIYESSKAGAECCFYYHYTFDDVLLRLDMLWSGTKAPYTKEEKVIIESGLLLPPRDDEKLYIPTGSYKMLQTTPISNEDELKRLLLPFTVEKQDGYFYLRFLRESSIECIMQLFFPL